MWGQAPDDVHAAVSILVIAGASVCAGLVTHNRTKVE